MTSTIWTSETALELLELELLELELELLEFADVKAPTPSEGMVADETKGGLIGAKPLNIFATHGYSRKS